MSSLILTSRVKWRRGKKHRKREKREDAKKTQEQQRRNPRILRKGREKDTQALAVPTNCENLLKDAGQHLCIVGLPCIGRVTRQISGWGRSHSPLTSPGVCSLTPHSGRWILHGNLGEGGREIGFWLKRKGRLQPHSHQHPRGAGLGRSCVITLTISDRCQFEDGVKGAFQVRHLL